MNLKSDKFDSVRKSLNDILKNLDDQLLDFSNIEGNNPREVNEDEKTYEERINKKKEKKLEEIKKTMAKIDAVIIAKPKIRDLMQTGSDIDRTELNNIINAIGTELQGVVNDFDLSLTDDDMKKINSIYEEKFTNSKTVTTKKKVEELENWFAKEFKGMDPSKLEDTKKRVLADKAKEKQKLALVQKYESLGISIDPVQFMNEYYDKGLLERIKKYKNDMDATKVYTTDSYNKSIDKLIYKFNEAWNNENDSKIVDDFKTELKSFIDKKVNPLHVGKKSIKDNSPEMKEVTDTSKIDKITDITELRKIMIIITNFEYSNTDEFKNNADKSKEITEGFKEEMKKNPLVSLFPEIESDVDKCSPDELSSKYKDLTLYNNYQKQITSIQTLAKNKSEIENNIKRLENLEKNLQKGVANPNLDVLKKEKENLEQELDSIQKEMDAIDVDKENQKITDIKNKVAGESGIEITDFVGEKNGLGTVKFSKLGDNLKLEDFMLNGKEVNFQEHDLEDTDYTDELVQEIFDELRVDNLDEMMKNAKKIKEDKENEDEEKGKGKGRLSSALKAPKFLSKMGHTIKEFFFPTDLTKEDEACKQIIKDEILETLKGFKNAYHQIANSAEFKEACEKLDKKEELENTKAEKQKRIQEIDNQLNSAPQVDYTSTILQDVRNRAFANPNKTAADIEKDVEDDYCR